MSAVTSADDVLQLREILGVDAIVIGSITDYDPYEPPKLGFAIELYFNPKRVNAHATNLRKLVTAPTGDSTQPAEPVRPGPPISVVSGFYDAADPGVHAQLVEYAEARDDAVRDDPARGWRLYNSTWTCTPSL